jgi:hypothetical protein
MNETNTRADLFAAIQSVSAAIPEMRIGQLMLPSASCAPIFTGGAFGMRMTANSLRHYGSSNGTSSARQTWRAIPSSKLAEPTDEADRGRHSGFARHEVVAADPASERSLSAIEDHEQPFISTRIVLPVPTFASAGGRQLGHFR